MAKGGARGSKVGKWRTHKHNLDKMCSVCANLEIKKGTVDRKPSEAEARIIVAKFNASFERGSQFQLGQGLR